MKAEKQHKVLQTSLIQSKQERSKLGVVDNRPQAASQTKLVESIQKKENKTGLPDDLKNGIENLSGYSMDDIRVHYNSDKPAQLQALAYANGMDIHVAPGQEKHLPHEAWYVVQQKQGRVQPTMQMHGVNDNEGLEIEADVMGKYRMNQGSQLRKMIHNENSIKSTVQCVRSADSIFYKHCAILESYYGVKGLKAIKNAVILEMNQWLERDFDSFNYYDDGEYATIDLGIVDSTSNSICVMMQWSDDDYFIFHCGETTNLKPAGASKKSTSTEAEAFINSKPSKPAWFTNSHPAPTPPPPASAPSPSLSQEEYSKYLDNEFPAL